MDNYKGGTCGKPTWVEVKATKTVSRRRRHSHTLLKLGKLESTGRPAFQLYQRYGHASTHALDEPWFIANPPRHVQEDAPSKSVVAGYDRNIKEDLYLCRITNIDSGTGTASVPGKTWFERSDSCCNVALDGTTHSASSCEVRPNP